MKIEQSEEFVCYCCCELPKDKRNLKTFETADRELYQDFTGLEISIYEAKLCVSCKESLSLSLDFLNLCKSSHKKLTDGFETSIDISDIPPEDIIYEAVDELIETRSDQDVFEDEDEEDDVPISEIKQKLDEETKIIEVIEIKKVKKNKNKKLKKYTCDFADCNMKFSQANALKCHKRIHSKERPFVCSYCKKSFSQNTTLKTHVAAKHTGKAVSCTFDGCDKKFARNSFLKQHIKRDHENKRDYVCSHCDKSYKQKSHLDRHVEASHMNVRHQCTMCEKNFSKSWTLKMHLFAHSNSKELPYKCSLCHDVKFQRRDKWLKHMTKTHPDSKIDTNPIEIIAPS